MSTLLVILGVIAVAVATYLVLLYTGKIKDADGDFIPDVVEDKVEDIKEDVAEVKALAKVLSGNQIRLLIGVKDGKYQSVYTKVFGRIKPERDDLFVKNLNDEYGTFNAEFDTTLAWGPFSPQLSLVTPDAEDDSPEEGDDWV